MNNSPKLSVIVVVVEGPSRLELCLSALAEQAGTRDIEVIVPWNRPDSYVIGLTKRFPHVLFPRVEGRRTYAQLRSFGIQQSKAPIVAITEDHCIPCNTWCAEILDAHQSPHAAVGGAVEKQKPDALLNWSFYLADYIRYLDPLEGPAAHLTDCNVSYKREILDRIAELWREEFHENTIHEALLNSSSSLWISPRILVRQSRSLSLAAALRDRYSFGRLFASTRTASSNAPKRIFYLASSVLIPLLLVARIHGHIRRTGRYTPEFLRALPLLLLISTAWAFGEFLGYLTGYPEENLRIENQEAALEARRA